MSSVDPERIIAVDLRTQSLGFVVLEGTDRILDWGVKSFRGGVNAVRDPLGLKISRLIAAYVPDAIVLRKRLRTNTLLRQLELEAGAQRVGVHFLSGRMVKDAFPHCRNKDEIASAICDRFLELLSVLPPKRKPFQKEDYRMRIFDAAATGMAYFAQAV